MNSLTLNPIQRTVTTKSSIEPIAEALNDLLDGFNNVGIKPPAYNTKPHTGALGALIVKLKMKLTQLFI